MKMAGRMRIPINPIYDMSGELIVARVKEVTAKLDEIDRLQDEPGRAEKVTERLEAAIPIGPHPGEGGVVNVLTAVRPGANRPDRGP
jgi:hypothetical protein